jgi:predicted NBD/HSP70 family sugar kinase
MLRVNPDGRHAIGLDLGASKFSGALVDLRGGVVKSAEVELDGRNGADAVEALYGLIDSLIRRNGTSSLLGVGIGAPGLVDSRHGIVRWSVNLDWTDLPLASMVAERFGMPVVVANDSQAAAFAESTFGSIPWPHNLIVVRVGLGIGAGIILEGKLFQGDGSGAGEIGHSIFGQVAQAGHPERCRCGRVGCLETVASMSAMVKAAHRGARDQGRAGAHRRVPQRPGWHPRDSPGGRADAR